MSMKNNSTIYHLAMPTLNKSFTLTVTPEQFLNACSQSELWEVNTLLSSHKFYEKMYGSSRPPEPEIDFGDANLERRINETYLKIQQEGGEKDEQKG